MRSTVKRMGQRSSTPFLKILATFMAVGLLLGACSSDNSSDAAPGDESPGTSNGDSGGGGDTDIAESVVVGVTTGLRTGNPLDSSMNAYTFAAFNSLIRPFGDPEAKGELAESWTNDDPTSYQFVIHDGVKFHNGEPLTAEDVAFSIELALSEGFAFAQNLETVESVNAVDDHTVEFKLTQPDPLFVRKAGAVPVIPKAYWEEVGAEGFNSAPIGSGPYKVVEFKPEEAVFYERFDDYWDEPAKTPKVELRHFTDPQALQSAFESGQIHVASGLSPVAIPTLRDSTDFDLHTDTITGTRITHLNTTKPPFDNPDLRRAANLAVDQESMLAALNYGTGQIEDGQLISEGINGFVKDLHTTAFDMDAAKELVANSDYNGEEVVIVGLANDSDRIEAIGGALTSAGFKIRIDALDIAPWLEQFRQGSDANIFFRGVSYTGMQDASRYYRWLAWSDKPFVTDPEWLELWDDQSTDLDPDSRQKTLEDMTRMIKDRDYVIFDSLTNSIGATVKGISGVRFEGAVLFNQIELAKN